MHVILVGRAKAKWDQADHLEPYYSALPFVWRFLDDLRQMAAAPAPPATGFVFTLGLPTGSTAQLLMSVRSPDTVWVHDILIR